MWGRPPGRAGAVSDAPEPAEAPGPGVIHKPATPSPPKPPPVDDECGVAPLGGRGPSRTRQNRPRHPDLALSTNPPPPPPRNRPRLTMNVGSPPWAGGGRLGRARTGRGTRTWRYPQTRHPLPPETAPG